MRPKIQNPQKFAKKKKKHGTPCSTEKKKKTKKTLEKKKKKHLSFKKSPKKNIPKHLSSAAAKSLKNLRDAPLGLRLSLVGRPAGEQKWEAYMWFL